MRQIREHAVISPQVILPEEITVGPFCVIEEGVILGEGCVLGAGCALQKGARLGAGVTLGHYVTVGNDAKIGRETAIGDHTTVYARTVLGEGMFVGSNTSLGRAPRPALTSTVKVQTELSPLLMGDECVIGCSVVLYAGTDYGKGVFLGDGATVREGCTIGESVVIGSGVTVENQTKIGAYTKIQTGSYITAYMEIEERVFIAPMVTTTNDNFMGRTEKRFKLVKGPVIRRGARVGGGAVILPGIEIAPETFVAAGALVARNTEEKQVVKGFPAKSIREVPAEELLD